jgi:hypothetical protein
MRPVMPPRCCGRLICEAGRRARFGAVGLNRHSGMRACKAQIVPPAYERRWSSGFHRRGFSGCPSRSLGGGAGTVDAAITGFILADLGFLASRLPLL